MSAPVEDTLEGASRREDLPEIVLLVTLVVLLPVEERLGALPGPGPVPSVSVAWVVFAAMAAYCVVKRPGDLVGIATERALLFGGALVGIALIMETVHPDTDLSDPVRIGQAVVGAALVATLCRSRAALRGTLLAIVAVGTVTSVVVIVATYGEWLAADDLTFTEITALRNQVWDPGPLLLDLHYAPFITVLGAVSALAGALAPAGKRLRLLLLAAAGLGFLGAALTTSRAAVVASVLGAAVAVAAGRGRRLQGAAVLLGILIAVVAIAPDAVFSRLEISSTDTRTRLAEATVDEAGSYLPFGVGAGRYEASWAAENGFTRRSTGEVQGTHNSFAQVTVFWGLAALAALVGVVVEAGRAVGRSRLVAPERTALWAMGAASLVYLVLSHTLYDKTFVLVLGLSVASGHWLTAVEGRER